MFRSIYSDGSFVKSPKWRDRHMKKREKRIISILLSLVLVLSLMPVMSLRAVAATDTYTILKNNATPVMFNNIDWYIIEDDSTAVDAGTVTLLAKEPIFHRSFNNNDTDGNNYKDSHIEKDLNSMTTSHQNSVF